MPLYEWGQVSLKCFAFGPRQPISHAAFNDGEFGDTRDDGVHVDARQRNSLRVAMKIGGGGGGGCPFCRFHDCGPHFAQTEQSDETALVVSLSQRSQFHFVARPNVDRVYSRSHDAMIHVYDAAGNVIETH
jgi:hypothetical protein